MKSHRGPQPKRGSLRGAATSKVEQELEAESRREVGSPSSLPLCIWVGYHRDVLIVCTAVHTPLLT